MRIRAHANKSTLIAIGSTFGVLCLGVYIIAISHAASPYVSVEAEASKLTGGAEIISNATASGDKYVQFGSNGFTYGVLAASLTHMQSDYQGGLRLVEIDLQWSSWEPSQGSFSSSYMTQMINEATAYRSAGFQIALSLGLQYPPAWVLQLPNGQLVNQTGGLSGTPNYEFNQDIRNMAQTYITNVINSMGLVNYYRIGLASTGEMGFGPETNSSNSWWAFDKLAQGSGSGLPYGITPTPMIGWIPGATTWNNAAVTTAQVQEWYNWYLGSLENAETWEIKTIRSSGYTGLLQLVMPGTGATPTVYTKRISDDLAAENFDGYNSMNVGAVYYLVLDQLPDLTNTEIDISGVYDGSGTPRGNACLASDTSESLSSADPWNSQWSSTRWMAYLAAQHHLALIGENPGENVSSELPAIFSLAKSCNLSGLMWAFDNELYNGVDASISDYANYINS